MMIKFNLSIAIDKAKVCKQDSVFLTGSSPCLGSWNLSKAIEMKFKHNEDNWSLCSATSNSSLCSSSDQHEMKTLEFEAFVNVADTTELGEDECIYYKYFIAQKTSQTDKVFLKQVENGRRKVVVDLDSIVLIKDKWPYYENDEKKPARVDLGWLLKDENEIQFHFYDNPLQLWNVDETEKKQYIIEIKPMKAANGLIELNDYTLSHLDFDESQYFNNKNSKFNALNDSNVYSSFRFRSHENPTNIVFQINIFEVKESGAICDQTVATSYYKVNKSLIENCLIDIDLSLLDSQQIIGSLKAEICMITSMNQEAHIQNYNLMKSFNYDYSRECLTIGHRGMGKTFDGHDLPHTTFIENTIESFAEAYERGADMVEFDIVLTKDQIPIIYHDFQFCITNKDSDELNKYIDIAVNQMTYAEIKKSRIYSGCVRHAPAADNCTSKLMFPTLKEMCTQLTPKLGFNVEIKYPQDIEDITHNEVGRHIKWLNRNQYADIIIKELFEFVCEDRCVILSTFDPLLCSMLRVKQNKFPVLFLTTGKTEKWIPYKDFRCKNTKISINYAKSEGLHGIVAHTEELTQNQNLIQDLFIGSNPSTTNFLRICWGDELNESNKRKLYKKNGLNGIIYDRIVDDEIESDEIQTIPLPALVTVNN